MKSKILLAPLFVAIIVSCISKNTGINYKPVIDGEWWNITNTPNLGEYNTDKQEPVDFGVWQAADGTWQLWSCIRHTSCGGNTRLFHAWEGKTLLDTAWVPKGVAMIADTTLGEVKGGLQAPYVMKENGIYYMFYGGWDNICLATSKDGKNFERVINETGTPELFRGPLTNPRDAMVIKEEDSYYCYYSAHDLDRSLEEIQAAIYLRKSKDMKDWSEPIMVSAGGKYEEVDCWGGGDAECPFVVKVKDKYVLFRNIEYGSKSLNAQYCSDNPEYFGIKEDSLQVGELEIAAPEIVEHEGQYYIVCLKKTLDGMRVAKLKWEEVK